MTGPFTDYDCPYCDQPAGKPCRSAGGFVYRDGAHQARFAAKDYKRQEGVAEAEGAEDKIKMALWFIRKAGGPEIEA